MLDTTEFKFGVIHNHDLLNEAFRLRYQVYCHECNFIKAEDYPHGFERDIYDSHSIAFFAQDSEGMIGTSRLVLDSPFGFPIEAHCKNNLFLEKNTLKRRNCAEISRLAISKEYLYKKVRTQPYSQDSLAKKPNNLTPSFKPLIVGVFREIYEESVRRGIEYVYALMERPLFVLLKKQGLIFHPIGEEINFYGPVRPYLGVVKTLGRAIMQMPRSSEFERHITYPLYSIYNLLQSQ